MGCSSSKAMETQATCATEYEDMLKAAQAAQKGVGEVAIQQVEISGGIAKNWRLNNSPKNKNDAKTASASSPVLMEDGSKYLGGWKDGLKHGKGKQLFKDGTVFEGTWKNGHADGPGKLEIGGVAVDGSGPATFEGRLKNSMADGPGVFTYPDGSKIEGAWKKDEKCGFFTETWSDGTKFKGFYVDGRKDGFGFQIWPDGSSYIGEFKADVLAGWGRYQWNDNRVVRSQWANNLMSGYGHFVWEDGRIYRGEYVEGKKEGFGLFSWPDGRCSQGYWKNSQLHGLNLMTNKAGASKWTLYHNGTREKFVDSASERAAMLKADGLVENPTMPELPKWLMSLPEEHKDAAFIQNLYEKFDGSIDRLLTTVVESTTGVDKTE